MKFEITPNNDVTLHPALVEALGFWRERKPALAFEAFRRVRKELEQARAEKELVPDDWHFVYALLNACSMFEQAKIVARQGAFDHPSDFELAIKRIWEHGAKGELFDAREQIEALRVFADEQQIGVLDALEVYSFSYAQWRVSADRKQQAAMETAGNDPLCYYLISRGASARSEWRDAAETGLKAVELAPQWARARATYADALLSQGRTDEAVTVLNELPDNATPFFAYRISKAFAFESLGDTDSSIDELKLALEDFPLRSRYQRFAARQLALNYMISSQDDAAEEVIRKFSIRKFPVERKSETGAKKLISLPLIAQAHNYCVPTVAAMVVNAQCRSAEPFDYADRMQSQNGTPMFRMMDVVTEEGFDAYCVRADVETIRYFIDRGVPLIGTLTGLLSSHVEVACGYDETLQVIHMRDPMHAYGHSIDAEYLQKRYSSGDGLIALVHESKRKECGEAEKYVTPEGTAYHNLSRAVSQGNRELAEQQFALIADDHPLAMARDSQGFGVVLTPTQFEERQNGYLAWDAEEQELTHFRAMLSSITEENADEILKRVTARQEKYGLRFVDFVRARCLVAKQQWKDAQKLLRRMTHEAPGMDTLWRLLASVEEQLGNDQESTATLDHALDISPSDLSLNRRRLESQTHETTYHQRLKRVEELVSANLDNLESKMLMKDTLSDDSDGKRYEEAALEFIRYQPRYPDTYEQLSNWYLYQGQTSLARKLMVEGRALIGEEELPTQDWEKEEEDKTNTPPNEPDATNVVSNDSKTGAAASPTGSSSDSVGNSEVFAEAMRVLIEDSEKLTSAEALSLKETEELLRLEKDGRLHWWQSASFRAFLIKKNLGESISSTEHGDCLRAELKELLPHDSMPGIPEHYAMRVLEYLNGLAFGEAPARILKEWIECTCPHWQKYPQLQFERAYLLEVMGLFKEAEASFEEIIQKFPMYTGSLYRKAQIARQQGDTSTARKFYGKCLEVLPGMSGAIDSMIGICAYENDPAELDYHRRLVKRFPYSKSNIFSAAYCAAKLKDSVDAGLEELERYSNDLSEVDFLLLQSRLAYDGGDVPRAKTILQRVDYQMVNDENRSIYSWLNIDIAVAESDYSRAESFLTSLLEDTPDDSAAIDQIVRIYREQNPSKAIEFATQKVVEGVAEPMLAYVICQNAPHPSRRATQLVFDSNVPDDKIDALANAFFEAILAITQGVELICFLRECVHRLPHNPIFRERLAGRLSMIGQDSEAVAIAKELYESNPDNPAYLRLYGICLQEVSVAESLELLEKEFAITGNSDTLVRMGRGHQLLGDRKRAIQRYREALELNPCEPLAITNLVHAYGIIEPDLLQRANIAISRGEGIQDQIFHVCVQKLANQLNSTVTPEWYSTAIERMELVQEGHGFENESTDLGRLIATWAFYIDDEETLASFSTWVQRLFWKILPPSRAWIPSEVLNQ